MQRQRSILSFFQKPSPENQNSGAGDKLNGTGIRHNLPSQQSFNGATNKPNTTNSKPAVSTLDEIRGTDTPPEKVPRQVLVDNLTPTDNRKSSAFTSIMHKFAKANPNDKYSQRFVRFLLKPHISRVSA